jgi:CHAT domain-containing protein/tetratricopeptide (TPR) repeat protein
MRHTKAHAVISDSSQSESSWFRKLNIDLWAIWQQLKAESVMLFRTPGRSHPQAQSPSTAKEYVSTILGLAKVLAEQSRHDTLGRFKGWRFFLTSANYRAIVSTINMIPRTMLATFSDDELSQVIRLGESILYQYEPETQGASSKKKGAITRWLRPRKYARHAHLHLDLALFYVHLHIGDISEHLEKAIAHHHSALSLLEQADLPELSARLSNALGTALLDYPTEYRESYAQKAIVALGDERKTLARFASVHEAHLRVMKLREATCKPPIELSLKYVLAVLREYALPFLLVALRAARRGIPFEDASELMHPIYLARAEWKLGRAYQQLGQVDKAIEHFDLALGACTHVDVNMRAAIEVSKGRAYLFAEDGDRRKNVDLAIKSFRKAMTGCIDKGEVRGPRQRTYVLALVGDAKAYFALHELDAIKLEMYEKTLPMLTTQLRLAARLARTLIMPQQRQDALFLLGKSYLLQRDIVKAYQSLALAARVADRTQRSARTPRSSRFFVGERAALDDLLIRVSLGYLSLGKKLKAKEGKAKDVPPDRILCFAERGRTVLLQTQLANLNLRPKAATSSDMEEFFEGRRSWHEAELRLLERESNPVADRGAMDELGRQRNVLESRYRDELEKMRERFSDPDYDPDKPIFSLRFSDLYSTVADYVSDEQVAVVEYHLTSRYLVVFVILPTELSSEIVNISIHELEAIKNRWQKGTERLTAGSSIHWQDGYLGQVLDRLRPVAEAPAKRIKSWEEKTGTRIKRIIIIPHRFLHLVPLHAVPLNDGSRWCDSVPIAYAPSASVLQHLLRSRCRKRVANSANSGSQETRKVVAISYAPPSGGTSLLFHRLETEAIIDAVGGELVEGPEATLGRVKEAIEDANYIHFACHGTFDSKAPLEAALELAAGDGGDDNGARQCARLTLGEIFQSVRLPKAPLVVLSACETGLTKIEKRHEEYVGLPAGFLYAGASTVICTLWRVSDAATWFLMRSFAREIAVGGDPANALHCAQQKLKILSREDVLQEIARAAEEECDVSRREQMIQEGQALPHDEFPFSGPYWWAGFTAQGL